MSNKKIPTADTTLRTSRLSIPRIPEKVNLPDNVDLVKDQTAKARPVVDLSGPPIQKTTPQELFEPSKIGPLQQGSLNDVPNPQIRTSKPVPIERDENLFRQKPQTQLSISEDGSPVIRPVIEPEPEQLIDQDIITDKNDPKYGNSFEPNTRRRQPPPVTANPLRTKNEFKQIPASPGSSNLPKEWQDLPQNFQDQVRRLLPIYYDITGPNKNLINRLNYVPPNLFEDGEPNPNLNDFLDDRSQYLDSSQYEPPNRSKIDFLNLLMSLFNLIFSLKSSEIKGNDYEVTVFNKIVHDEQRTKRSTDTSWKATIREKVKNKQSVDVGGRTAGEFQVGEQFPVKGSEVTVQSIVVESRPIVGGGTKEFPIKVILSNGEEILRANREDNAGSITYE